MKSFDHDLIQKVNNSKKILVTSHIYPDGDAAGSVMGLVRSLRLTGKTVDIAWFNGVGDRFDFLFEKESILTPQELHPGYDVVMILDIGSEDRTGFQDIIRELGCSIINIDHHATNTGFADYDHVDIDASSTCEVVFHLIKTAGWPLDASVGECLYTGLVTDSRHFQNEGVTADTFLTAAELKKLGIDSAPIIRRLVQNRTAIDLRVLGLALSTFELLCNGQIAIVVLRDKDIKALGADYRHAWSSGIFSYLVSLESALVGASFIEAEAGKVFCEFRSKLGFDVSRIAARFGGGGHRGASGCSQEKPIEQFVQEITDELIRQVTQFKVST
ncbi:DHH family phosphoesterase [bacterium]|nr:DHH family phosphoesterase [candidate division CSSED10-310 bacterium]